MSKASPVNARKPDACERVWNWRVTSAFAGLRIDTAIVRAMALGLGAWDKTGHAALSRSRIQRLLEDQGIKTGSPVVEGQAIQLHIPAPESLELIPEERKLNFLFEDDHLVIVNKPQGLTVHPSETQKTGTLVHALLGAVKDLSGIGGKLRPGIVHRIDKDTSGALVISKTDRAHQGLVEIFSRHAIERVYWALCYGTPARMQPDGGWKRIQTLIGRHPTDRKRMSCEVKRGRSAITEYRPLEIFGTHAAWIEARLETGRTHQIRVHLTHEKLSILGDPVYGKPTASQPKWKALPAAVQDAVASLPGQALHARILGFKHPVTGESVRVEAPPPPAFEAVLQRLRANHE